MTKEELIELSDLNREDNIKYISSEAQGIAITLDSDRYAPTLCKLERAYICGRRKSENRIDELIALINAERKRQEECDDVHLRKIVELEKENAELKAQLESERDLPAIAYQQGAEKQKKKDEEELKKWKAEWQEQVQKATDEGYARTLQTIQLTKAKVALRNVIDYLGQFCSDYPDCVIEAEQFLKDCDIDNAIQQANKGLDFDKIADEIEQDLKDSEVEK